MGLVAIWLTGCGLSHAIPNFTAAGIVTPAALAELDLTHYEALGVSSPEDRRKLFYLVQRIKLAVEKDGKDTSKTTPASVEEQVDAVIQSTTVLGGSTSLPGKENEAQVEDEVQLSQQQSHGESTGQEIGSSKQSLSAVRNSKSSSSSPDKSKNGAKKSPSKLPAPSKRSPSKLLPPRAGVSNRPATTSTGETTTPSKTSSSQDDLDNQPNDDSAEESSAWEGGEEDDCADDEASEAVVAASTRRSKRIAEKSQSIVKKGTGASSANKSLAKPTGLASNKPKAASGLTTPLPKSKQPKANRPTSSLPRPSTRLQSKLQNPSKSMRTGKQLSTIPADSILPMSPMPPAQLDSTNRSQPTNAATKPNLVGGNSTRGTRSNRSRRSDSGATSDSDAESVGSTSSRGSRSSRNRRTTLASSRIGGRRTSGNASDSDSSMNSGSRRRRTMGVVSSSVSKTKGATSKTIRVSEVGIEKKSKIPTTRKKQIIIQGGPENDKSFKAQIEARRQEIKMEHDLFTDDIFQEDGDEDEDMIKVIVRKRPFNKDRSSDVDVIHPLEYSTYGKIIVYQPNTRVDLTKEVITNSFAFDTVFDEQDNNWQIYQKSVRSMIPVVLNGESHATIFAFGATGSGKTFTTWGANFTGDRATDTQNSGLMYLAAVDLFRCLEDDEFNHLSVGVSLFEIYGGKLFDLLNERKAVKCLEDHKGKVNFPGLSEHQISGPGDLMDLVELGASARSTGTTSRNADSSRSHAVLQLHLRKDVGRKRGIEHGRLTFIDLAGSERGADTANYSRATRLEGAEINTSLLALKEVIRARARGGSMVHVPFRGSKLTQVLKESFVGENSRCVMIACIAPELERCEVSLDTLRYADRVKERNPDSGALPAKFSRGSGRRRKSVLRASASVSSILSASDQSMFMSNGPTNKFEEDCFGEGGSSTENKSSMKESGAEAPVHGRSRSHKKGARSSISEDSTDALLASVLSDDTNLVETESEAVPASNLVDELVATHQSFLHAVLGMVQDEMNVLGSLKENPYGIESKCGELDSMLESQLSLISDLRECFQTYESIQATVLGEQLQSHRNVLTALLSIVSDEIKVVRALPSSAIGQVEGKIKEIESLQESKLGQMQALQACFSSKAANADDSFETAKSSVSKGHELFVSESFASHDEVEALSEGSDFEDLRV